MHIIEAQSWKEFREWLVWYAAQPRWWREQLLFRGQCSDQWKLETTLDRHCKFKSDRERSLYYDELLGEFRRQIVDLGISSEALPAENSDALELLARHHGLPSPLLDWTESPYIAAYFAFAGVTDPASDSVGIWAFQRNLFDFEVNQDKIRLVDEHELLRFNRRALRQRSLFTHVRTGSESLEDILSSALAKYVIPSHERVLALADLDEMTINASALFPDLDGAVRTAVLRVSLQEGVING